MTQAGFFDFTPLLTPPVCRLIEIIAQGGGEARIVGGAVRDHMLGRAVGDIDLAVNLPPAKVIDLLTVAGIKTVPTGLAHGTITAVIDRIGYEITTLRRDIATDGRHAEVEFTNDWHSDAARRDFTFNALYIARDGNLTDFFDGVADAKAGRVRFIGQAAQRIEEDVLRILRFFRFYAWFGMGAADTAALDACRRLASMMPRLSAERVARETLKLLAAPDPVTAWRLMETSGVTAHFLAEAKDTQRLQKLVAREVARASEANPLRRLAALLPQDPAVADVVAKRLKLAVRDGNLLRVLAVLPTLLQGHLEAASMRQVLYDYGAADVRAALPLMDMDSEGFHAACTTIAAWDNPTLPIRGEDIVAMGVTVGPQVGMLLRQVEKDWRDGDFRADRAACLGLAREYGKNH